MPAESRQQRCHGRHHDRAESQQAGIVDCVRGVLSVFSFALHRKVNHHDAVLLHNADQKNNADDCDHTEILLEDNERE